ncbi:hypothetical protein pdam_00018785 [Pocillopora damicornis]|uniref:G-protein coupled receptors family 1 profile domain-containing protein n=1 Tax=Pocillopora damicornis TaxID=46731 RepID=A0A3M6V301_POCDA|nr:hypothetical protein pdam_00018785 [Pocillopora damicornis]
MAENVCDHLNEVFFGTSTDVEDFRSVLVASCVFNSFLSYTTIILNICLLGSIGYHLSSHKVGDYDCLLHSGIQEAEQGVQNGDLSNFLKLRKSALGTFYVCIVFLLCYLPFYIIFCLFLARPSSLIALHEAWHYTVTLVFLNSYLNPVIYCWKMEPIPKSRLALIASE